VKRLMFVLAMLGVLGLACSLDTNMATLSAPQVITVVVQATALPLPTYTPYPTLAQPTAQSNQGASDDNVCALRISGGGYTFYVISTGVGLAAMCPTMIQQMRDSDTQSLLSITIVYTFPTKPVICTKDYGGQIQVFVVDTESDTRLSQTFCGGLS
jgi:hypothetical protein